MIFITCPYDDHFTHCSPFGTINGKEAYLKLVETNNDKFLGHRFEIHDALYEKTKPVFFTRRSRMILNWMSANDIISKTTSSKESWPITISVKFVKRKLASS